MILSEKSKYPIGLDISDLSLKLIQLQKKHDKIHIQALGKYDLRPGVIDNGVINNPEALVEAIDRILIKPKFGHISSHDVVACLPETKTFMKLIEIQKSPNKLEQIVGNEIEKYIPSGINDLYFDWQLISENSENYQVLIGAAPKIIVEQYINTLKSSKLSVIALEIEPIAIVRALLKEEGPKYNSSKPVNYGIVDIGASRSSFIIYAGNAPVLSMSIPSSGEESTKLIAKTLDIKRDEAEKSKIICGLDKTKANGIVSDILSQMVNELIAKINNVLEYYKNNYSDLGPINNILITGGGSNIKNINNIISNATGINAAQGDAFIKLIDTNESFSRILKGPSSRCTHLSYVTAIGLALRKLYM